MKIMKKAVCMVFLSAIIILGTDIVWANTVLTGWQSASMSSETAGTQCPLEVEKERIIFDISEFPSDENQNCDNRVTIAYTVHNPTDTAVKAKLFCPLGMAWEYEKYRFGDTEKYGVFADGTPVKAVLRHFYVHDGMPFEPETDLLKLKDGFDTNSFFQQDLLVTEYIYEISGVDTAAYDAASAGFVLDCNPAETRVYFEDYYDLDYDEESRACPRVWAENGMQLHLYVIGEPLIQNLTWRICENGAMEKEIAGSVNLIETNQMTLREYVTENWNPERDIRESDWYNAMVYVFDSCTKPGGFIGELYIAEENLAGSLRSGFEYEITAEAGQTIVNEIVMPIYPSFRRDYEPFAYEYVFNLSSPGDWSHTDELEINVNTPFYMLKSELVGFEQTENGYMARLSNFPKEELSFILSATEEAYSRSEDMSERRAQRRTLRLLAIGIGILVLFFARQKSRGK